MNISSNTAFFLAIVLDCLLGDPERLPHPIRLFGWVIAKGESLFNQGRFLRLKGILLASICVVGVWGFFFILSKWLADVPLAWFVVETLCVFYALSNRSLITESLKVENLAQLGDIPAARKQLGRIVGRDTANLDSQQIRLAVLETLSENLSDGVVAPLFFYVVGGVPFMMAYKMVNTLDSMIAYKNSRFMEFGWFAARLDDIVNFIPARLTALIMLAVPPNFKAAKVALRYGKEHASPNAGYPEAALAGILDCRFGGPNAYHGVLVHKPYIGTNPRQVTHRDVLWACTINARTFLVACVFVWLLR